VEGDGDVAHAAPLLIAERWNVRPPAAEVDPGGCASDERPHLTSYFFFVGAFLDAADLGAAFFAAGADFAGAFAAALGGGSAFFAAGAAALAAGFVGAGVRASAGRIDGRESAAGLEILGSDAA
jgi:hypothetical protein